MVWCQMPFSWIGLDFFLFVYCFGKQNQNPTIGLMLLSLLPPRMPHQYCIQVFRYQLAQLRSGESALPWFTSGVCDVPQNAGII